MDDAKAKDLIQLLVEHGTALTPTFKMQYPGYPKDWARFEQEDRKLLSDPNLAAYYPADRAVTAMATYNAIRIPPWCGALCADYNVPETPEVHERRDEGISERAALPQDVCRRRRPPHSRRQYQRHQGSRESTCTTR